MSTKNKIILIVCILLAVFILIMFIPKSNGKYDKFAQALTSSGAKFYGAFWCSHCQAQKAEFGSSKKYLPYIECSKPDRSQTQICIDNKIEGYPSWTFKDGINLSSNREPTICEITFPAEPIVCKNRSSQYCRTWLFPDYKFSIKSSTDPVHEGALWKFESGAEASGEIPLTFLAEQIKFNLPQ